MTERQTSSQALQQADDFIEVRDEFIEAARQLKLGEFIQCSDFSMASVMSAVEIGDPRLDAGMEQNRSKSTMHDNDTPEKFPAADILAVMDHLLILEATWHKGSNMAQTIYTCHYLLQPHKIKHQPLLSAFCNSVRVAAHTICDLVKEAQGGPIEEFDIFAFSFPAGMGAGDIPQALAEIASAEDWLGKGMVAPRQPLRRHAELQPLLLARLRFRRDLLFVLQKLLANTKDSIGTAKSRLYKTLAELQNMQFDGTQDTQAPAGFSPDINRHMMGTAPPKPVQLLDRVATLQHYTQLIQELLTVVTSITQAHSWHSLEGVLQDVDAKNLGPVARCILSVCVRPSPSPRAAPVPWAVSQGMMRGVLGLQAADLLSFKEFQDFMEQSCRSAGYHAQSFCLNKARQRRCYKKFIQDWGHLYHTALSIESMRQFDGVLKLTGWQWNAPPGSRTAGQGPLSLWIEGLCTRDILRHLLLGFELECYLPGEYTMVYWYCNHLYDAAINASNFLGENLPTKEHSKASKKPSKKLGSNSTGSKGPGSQALEYFYETGAMSMEQQLCRGLMRAAFALQKAGYIQARPQPFNTDEQYFEQRFFPFANLPAPLALPYDRFKVWADVDDYPISTYLQAAENEFAGVRHIAARLQPTETSWQAQRLTEKAVLMDKIAKQNCVTLAILSRSEAARQQARSSGEGEVQRQWEVSFDFSQHPFFPVLKLGKRK